MKSVYDTIYAMQSFSQIDAAKGNSILWRMIGVCSGLEIYIKEQSLIFLLAIPIEIQIK